MDKYYALIMAGGSGTRLWPLSRRNRPKQVLRLVGERTMFQLAVDRLWPLFPPERILTITTEDVVSRLRAQSPELPAENFIVEPEGRGTAPVIGLGALHVRRRDPQAVMACLTSDHYIRNEARFREVLTAAAQVAQTDQLVTLGIQPTFASTGFGYIERGELIGEFNSWRAFSAAKFKEKPALPEAQAFIADRRHSWNSGMFVWRAERILSEFERQMPKCYSQLTEIEAALGTPAEAQTVARIWPAVDRQTIDYGIMEGAREVAVIPADGLGWSDVGSWASLLDVLPPDDDGNVVIGGEHTAIDTTGSLIHSDRLVATIGVKDLIIVDTEDVLLVCPRERAQDVKAVVEKLQGGDGPQYV